ncbi:MAG TPA: Fe-S oxidoreductase [Lachnospiraceae bacterium]|nr:Fe-S oxidoreductase [Lachnospiraceae bacterium]
MKVRVRFSKLGIMKFIGHLDVMHFFQQLLRRSDIPIAYSSGLSPHQIMSFALPLGIGLESIGEYMDIELTERVSSEEAIRRMNLNSVNGIEILSFKELPEKAQNAMASVSAADYEICPGKTGFTADALKEGLSGLFSEKEIVVLKRTKKNEQEIDIKPFIYEHSVKEDGTVFLRLSCGSVNNIKPELVMGALCKYMGAAASDTGFAIKRLDLYREDILKPGEVSGRFISLDSTGEPIK